MNLRNIILSKESQTQKGACCMSSFLSRSRSGKPNVQSGNSSVVAWSWECKLGLTTKGPAGTWDGDGEILYLDYKRVYICQNSLNCIFHLFLKILYIYLAVLGLCCCTWAFPSCGRWGLLSSCGAWAPYCRGFSCCGAQASGTWAQYL